MWLMLLAANKYSNCLARPHVGRSSVYALVANHKYVSGYKRRAKRQAERVHQGYVLKTP